MKDYDNVMKACVEYYPYEGYWFVDNSGEAHAEDFEGRCVVLYDDYKELLQEYKKLKWRIEQLEK